MHRVAVVNDLMYHMDHGKLYITHISDPAKGEVLDMDELRVLMRYLFSVGYLTVDTIEPFHYGSRVPRRKGQIII